MYRNLGQTPYKDIIIWRIILLLTPRTYSQAAGSTRYIATAWGCCGLFKHLKKKQDFNTVPL